MLVSSVWRALSGRQGCVCHVGDELEEAALALHVRDHQRDGCPVVGRTRAGRGRRPLVVRNLSGSGTYLGGTAPISVVPNLFGACGTDLGRAALISAVRNLFGAYETQFESCRTYLGRATPSWI